MGDGNQTLALLTLRVRQLIGQLAETRSANAGLRQQLAERDKLIADLQEQARQAERDFESLKTARMLAVADGDIDAARRRLAALIRNVNRCITLISES